MSRLAELVRQHVKSNVPQLPTQYMNEKKRLKEVTQQQLREMSHQEEKFEEMRRARTNTPLTDRLQELNQNEMTRLKREYPMSTDPREAEMEE